MTNIKENRTELFEETNSEKNILFSENKVKVNL